MDSTTAAGVCDGSSDMTDGNAVQPASIARPPQAPLPGAKDAAGTGNRLAWLDVLRGLAALCVVFNHFGFFVPPRVQAAVYQWINPGDYGVFVFFIISSWEDPDPETSVFSQLLMTSNVLAGKNLPNVVRSLSYEMIFYLLLTALFMARVHRRSGRYALPFAVAVAVALGGVLPQACFTSNLSSPRFIAVVADLVVLAGLAFAVAMRGLPRVLGAVLAAVVGLTLLAFNGTRLWPWEARRTGTVPVLIAMCSLTYLLVERPMQNAGRRLARWLDASFGSDRAPGWAPAAAEPVPAHHGRQKVARPPLSRASPAAAEECAEWRSGWRAGADWTRSGCI